MNTTKDVKYYSGQYLNKEDLELGQNFTETRNERIAEELGRDGVTRIDGLVVSLDSVVVEPFSAPTVANAGVPTSSYQNYRSFPVVSSDTSAQLYQVFKALTDNVQRIDLKVQLASTDSADCYLTVELRQLTQQTSPQSAITNTKLYSTVIDKDDIPTGSDLLVVDCSSANDGSGVSVTVNNYYAIYINFVRDSGSSNQLNVYHSNVQNTGLDSTLYAWYFNEDEFEQGMYDDEAVLQQFVLYHKVYTSAVKVSSGVAYKNGKPIVVSSSDHRYLSLATTKVDEDNYIVIKYKTVEGDAELHPRTRNYVYSSITDSSEVAALTQSQWNTELAKDEDDRTYLLLAKVTDKNIIPVYHREKLELDDITNLAYHNWLNPSYTIPSVEALQIQDTRPNDFIFFLESVPAEIPLLDSDGRQVYNSQGTAQTESISSVYVIIYSTTENAKELEMSVVSETDTQPAFRNYACTITGSQATDTSLYSYYYDVHELTPNTFYNFVAYTDRGTAIFIQDYNIQIKTIDSTTNVTSLTRRRQYEVFLNAGAHTVTINEDLKLGVDSTNLSEEIISYEYKGQRTDSTSDTPATYGELTKIGTEGSSTVVQREDTIEGTGSSYLFSPIPAVEPDGDTIFSSTDLQAVADAAVESARSNSYFIIKVKNANHVLGAPYLADGVDITLSGTSDSTKGGNGGLQTITGSISSTVVTAEGWASLSDSELPIVKVRNSDGKDCSDQSTTVKVTRSGTDYSYTIIARGIGTGSTAGFYDGETVYLWIGNRRALISVSGSHTTWTFTPGTTVTGDDPGEDGYVGGLETDVYFFGEKTIKSSIDRAVQADVNSGEISFNPNTGQIIWAENEEPPTDAIITIEYYHLDQTAEEVVYYQAQYYPFGTNDTDGIPIANTNDAITAAVVADWIVIKIDGTDITGAITYTNEDGNTVTGPLTVKADVTGNYPVAIGNVLVNPTTGKIIFHRTQFPISTSTVTITYYRLRSIYASTAAYTGEVYDVRYDLSGSGEINDEDLNIFLQAYGSSSGDSNYSSDADFDNDGDVDYDDLQELYTVFGTKASGSRDWQSAITQRLNAILVYKKDDPLKKLIVVKASSRVAQGTSLFGRTVLFLNEDDYVLSAGTYVVQFGFSAALYLGPSSLTVTTTSQLPSNLNLNTISVYNESDSSIVLTPISNVATARTSGNTTVYDNVITFTPPVYTTGYYIVKSQWESNYVAVIDERTLVIPTRYEEYHRRYMGPFNVWYRETDFQQDGTSITIRFDEPEAVYSNGTVDTEGLHIMGIPITDIKFSVFLYVVGSNNEVNIWRWNRLTAANSTSGLVLSFNDNLDYECRYRGKDKAAVLQPFGTASNQVALMPEYAGGDLENNLSNLIVMRDDTVGALVTEHDHSSATEGGTITSDDITFYDPDGRLTTGSITDVIYEILDSIDSLS